MRPVRAPSWSAQDTLIGCMHALEAELLERGRRRGRGSPGPSAPARRSAACLPNLLLRGADRLDAEHRVDQAADVEHLADVSSHLAAPLPLS